MEKVPQLMSDRSRLVENVGKFIVERLHANIPVDVLCMPFFDRDVDGEAVTLFDTLEAADAAASLMNETQERPFKCRAVHLVDNLNGPRIYRSA